MKTNPFQIILFLTVLIVVSSCIDYEDDGPIQYQEKYFSLSEFNNIDVSDALVVEIKQGNYFSIKARGDRRNLDDLQVRKSGNTLIVHFKEWETRQHTTYLEITMPALQVAHFSGATNTKLSGFYNQEQFALHLSGAAIAQADVAAETISINLSGASILALSGNAKQMTSSVSGASSLKALDLLTEETSITISGASVAKVWVSLQLEADLSGASLVSYKGNPNIESRVIDSSILRKE